MGASSKEPVTCTELIQRTASKISEMSGISKIFKFTSSSAHAQVPKVAATATSSVDPHCAYIAQKKYLRSRRLVTRTDVRARMSVWTRLFNWCRGGRKFQQETESIFTMRP